MRRGRPGTRQTNGQTRNRLSTHYEVNGTLEHASGRGWTTLRSSRVSTLEAAFKAGFDAGWDRTGEGFNAEWARFTNTTYNQMKEQDWQEWREKMQEEYAEQR